MEDFILFVTFLLGCICLVVNIGHRMSEGRSGLVSQAEQAKLECESTLPRNQHCEVIIKAIPVEE